MDYISIGALAISILAVYLRWKPLNEESFKKKVEEILHMYMENHLREALKKELMDDEFRQFIEDVINQSDINKKLDRLILILCTNDDRIKNTSICQGL